MPCDYTRPLSEKTIASALEFVRAQVIREGGDGLEHVEALLRLRGIDPDSLYVPPKIPRRHRSGELIRAIDRALGTGPSATDLAR